MDASIVSDQFLKAIRRATEQAKTGLVNEASLQSYLLGHGYNVTISAAQLTAIQNAFGIAGLFESINNVAADLENGIGDPIALIADVLALITRVGEQINSSTNSSHAALPAPFNQQSFWDHVPTEMIDRAAYQELERSLSTLASFLLMMGIAEVNEVIPADPSRIAYTQYILHWDKLGQLFTDPGGLFKTNYQWGNNPTNFLYNKFQNNLQRTFHNLRFPARYEAPEAVTLNKYYSSTNPVNSSIQILKIPLILEIAPDFSSFAEIGFMIMPIPDAPGSAPTGFFLAPLIKGAVSASTAPTSTGLSLIAKGGMETDGLFRADIRPSGTTLASDATLTAITAEIGIKGQPENPYILIGSAYSHRLELEGFYVSLAVKGNVTDPEVIFKMGTGESTTGTAPKLKFILQAGEGDGFIKTIIGDQPVSIDLAGLISFSSKYGIGFNGNAGFKIDIPIHQSLGPIVFNSVVIDASVGTDTPPKIGLGLNIGAQLGPLNLVVEQIGAQMVLKSVQPGDPGGIFGNLAIDWRFQPPKGIGISVDAGGLTGGGYLFLDFERGEYAGALELSFKGMFSLKAIGILNTKMPDGSGGFSLLILITAEFAPIQLSFGFTLLGVGGLLGLNRSSDIEALRTGVRTGAINSILFPQDVIANITRIISDLKMIFPPVNDRFVICPMGKIGWGTPTLISLELGLLIEIPIPRIAILGVLRAALPTEELPLLNMQVNFLGVIDFEKGLISFDATLYDSRLLIYTLTGDMALRIGWGDTTLFVLSVGGFHPAFSEVPSELTSMARLSISLFSGNNPRLVAQTYFAVTSNTVQSGSRVELYAEAAGFNIYGFLGYDLLVQFSPFHFIADIYAGLAFRRHSTELAGVSVHARLSGPTPWNAQGSASLKILFVRVSVSFDETWGDATPSQPVESENVLLLMIQALKDERNWKADIPSNTNLSVTVKKIKIAQDKIIVHPFGILAVSQKIAPLNYEINKFGNKKVNGDTEFILTYTSGSSVVKEQFAIASFTELNDNEKISRPSFQQMDSGLILQSSNVAHYGAKVEKEVVYEMSYVQKKKYLVTTIFLKIYKAVFSTFLPANAIANAKYAVNKNISYNGPMEITNVVPSFSVVNVSNLEKRGTAFSEAEAFQLQDTLVKQDPSLKGRIQVMSHIELSNN